LAEGVIAREDAARFLTQCLNAEDSDLIGKFDEAIRGFLLKLDDGFRADLTRKLTQALPANSACRLLKRSPFQGGTWALVNEQGEAMREQYWREVSPGLASALCKSDPVALA
jgi:hypothetical protein